MYSLAFLGIYISEQQIHEMREVNHMEPILLRHGDFLNQVDYYYLDNPLDTHDFSQKEAQLEKIYVFDWLFESCKKLTSFIRTSMYQFFDWVF